MHFLIHSFIPFFVLFSFLRCECLVYVLTQFFIRSFILSVSLQINRYLTRCTCTRAYTDDYLLLVRALAGVAFEDFDVESTGKHEKEYDRARRMQQDGHVIPSALTVTCGTVTNLSGINGTLFTVQVVPSQRTQAPCVCVCVCVCVCSCGVAPAGRYCRKPIVVLAVVPVHVGTTRSCSSAKWKERIGCASTPINRTARAKRGR